MSSTASSPPASNAVQPYRMHVSQRYLDLTRQKLELTRLPREPRNVSRNFDDGVSRQDLESLLDYWTERYDWRKQESLYNDLLPQFRVPINGTRLHFVHQRSESVIAIPLLFIHGWPESFIAVSKIMNALCTPEIAPGHGCEGSPAFHVVAPSIPGFAFSDPVPEAGNNMHATAEIFDALMKGLGYHQYLLHGTGWGFRVARMLALIHPESCLGIHTVNPEVPAPRTAFDLVYGSSHRSANLMADCMSPVANLGTTSWTSGSSTRSASVSDTNLDRLETLAYALCDSPSGLLSYIVDAIRPVLGSSPPHTPGSSNVQSSAPSPATPRSCGLSPQSTRPSEGQSPRTPQYLEAADAKTAWSPSSIVDWTMLYWLPGSEVALRWVAASTTLLPTLWAYHSAVPLAISYFQDAAVDGKSIQTPRQWAEAYHRVMMLRRREGQVRFPAWERPAEMIDDIRAFARLLYLPASSSPYEYRMH